MKRSSFFFFLFLFPVLKGYSTPPDTTIRGVAVQFTFSRNIFPVSWRDDRIKANGQAIDPKEVDRSLVIVTKALRKYPASTLQKELRTVYFVKSLEFFGVAYGGTNSNDALYLANNGASMGFTDLYLEQTFHHEYSSILYRNHTSWFDEKGWTAINPSGFIYNDPENGVGAIRNNASSQELDTLLCKKGFLTQYSQSSLENDLNTFAQNLFSPSEGFWEIADKYPAIRRKMKLLVSFYNQIDPAFTEDYFRSLH